MNRFVDYFGKKEGRLNVQGIDIADIAQKLGSPFYLYDASIMRRSYKTLKSALEPSATAIYYSLKANPNMAVADIFRKIGAGCEVASAEELKIAIAAGFSPQKIIFAGPGKSEQELALAVKNNIGAINVESATEFDRIVKIASRKKKGFKKVKVAFRVNLDIEVASDSGIIMLGSGQKFGITEKELLPLVKKAVASPVVEFIGFHCFAGTQITKTSTLASIYKKFARWAKTFADKNGVTIKYLNFGGGLGIPFTDTQSELNVTLLGKALAAIKRDLLSSPHFTDVKFVVEPGRYLVGPSGVYVARITDIKASGKKRFVITDGGIHHALIPIVMNKNYPTYTINRLDEPRRTTCQIVGPLCSSADQLSRTVKIPEPKTGDLIGIFNSGAYGYTAGMLYFLSHPTPAEALIDNKKLFLIRARKNADRGILREL